MNHRDHGFTIIEIMVAITISLLVTGVAMYAFNRLEHYRSIHDKQLRYAEEAQAFFSMLERELSAVYVYGGDRGYTPFEIVPLASPYGAQLAFTASVDGLSADHAKLKYYVVRGHSNPLIKNGLYRIATSPGYATPPEEQCLFAPDVVSLDIRTEPSPVPAGTIPTQVLAIIKLPDPNEPDNRSADKTWSHWIRVENATP
jgi:prepilin-type N-terminal cleavage/methylation domain-containing protein